MTMITTTRIWIPMISAVTATATTPDRYFRKRQKTKRPPDRAAAFVPSRELR
jgi:hypothetical protein